MKAVKEVSKEFNKKLSLTHRKGLKDFITTFSDQKKIKTVSDLLLDMMYEYSTSTNGTNHILCILRKCPKGCKYDCMINVEAREFGDETTYAEIFVHKPGKSLWDIKSWIKEKR